MKPTQIVQPFTKLYEPRVARNRKGEFHYINRHLLHREGDLPAITWANGSVEWWTNGKCQREGGKPAVIWADGTKQWWVNGRRVK